jgi:hypothetical protein
MTRPMRMTLRCSIALAVAALVSAAPMAGAQSAPGGDWQGKLEDAGLLIVLHINKNGPSTLDSPKQGAYGIKAVLTSKDSIVDFTAASIGATYHGVLHGTTITGTFEQHGRDVPLTFASIKAGSAKSVASAPNPGPPLPASLGGTWRGTLNGPNLPLVLHVNPAGVSTIDSPAQNASGMRAKVMARGDSVRFVVPAVRALFRGTFKGSAMTGVFSQNGATLPLTLNRTGG